MHQDTKEKPFTCHCGASFGRRDLLTRHHRIAGHEGTDIANNDRASDSIDLSANIDQDDSPAGANLPAAVSNLSATQNHYLQPDPEAAVSEMVEGGNEYTNLINRNGYLADQSADIYGCGTMIV